MQKLEQEPVAAGSVKVPQESTVEQVGGPLEPIAPAVIEISPLTDREPGLPALFVVAPGMAANFIADARFRAAQSVRAIFLGGLADAKVVRQFIAQCRRAGAH